MLVRWRCVVWGLPLLLAVAARADEPALPSFGRAIRPILAARCFKCHGPAVQEAGLRLDDPTATAAELASGDRAVAPGDVAQSALLSRVASDDPDLRMPPATEGPPLTPGQIALLRTWIAGGAEWEPHWAYRRVVRPRLPQVHASNWPRNAIDRFVLAELEARGLEPAPEADKPTLLRRITLDLTGLPPTPEELERFLADQGSAAYERVVDRLLASPQTGVRLASQWLDLARYADTDGYPHDGPRDMWPWRDWVVEALNADMPFDQFTIEQLAGDLLPDPTPAQRIATGFHRNTRINREAGVDPEEYRLLAVIDRVNTTASVWLGSTLACAQCHDHKYDPFTQRDYYRLLAFFNQDAAETTRDESGKISDVSPKVDYLRSTQIAEIQAHNAVRLILGRGRFGDESISPDLAPARALVMQRAPVPRATYLLIRGSYLTPGPQVAAGVPEVLAAFAPLAGSDRLALARWLVDPGNPLVARVTVNRIWQRHFGSGLVTSLDDFGTQATPAVHHDLLDWMASELVRLSWRTRPLVRLIVTSATYRQSGAAPGRAPESDPENCLLGRMPRLKLPAEVIRDQALAVAGILDLECGGPSTPSDEMVGDARRGPRYRRTLYCTWKRQSLDDALVNFDAPSRDVTCAMRTATCTPLQALNLLNDSVHVDAARGLARRMLSASADPAERIAWGFRAVLCREAAEGELAALAAFYQRRLAALVERPSTALELWEGGSVAAPAEADPCELAALTQVASALLNLDETIHRP